MLAKVSLFASLILAMMIVSINEARVIDGDSCPEGETYSDCSAHCDAYCPFKGPYNTTITRLPCANECRAGCACSSGYVRNIKTRKCILRAECPKVE